jgi:hypothetical protein
MHVCMYPSTYGYDDKEKVCVCVCVYLRARVCVSCRSDIPRKRARGSAGYMRNAAIKPLLANTLKIILTYSFESQHPANLPSRMPVELTFDEFMPPTYVGPLDLWQTSMVCS